MVFHLVLRILLCAGAGQLCCLHVDSGACPMPVPSSCLYSCRPQSFSSDLLRMLPWMSPPLSRVVYLPVLVMDYGANPWVDLRKSSKLPRAASGCAVTNLLLRVRGQQLRRCSPLLEVLLSTFLMEPPRPLAAHQVGVVFGLGAVQLRMLDGDQLKGGLMYT